MQNDGYLVAQAGAGVGNIKLVVNDIKARFDAVDITQVLGISELHLSAVKQRPNVKVAGKHSSQDQTYPDEDNSISEANQYQTHTTTAKR